MLKHIILLMAILPTLTVEDTTKVDWPQFRGPDGQGHHSGNSDLPFHWSEEEGVTWKVKVPGLGWSSPVARGNEVWLTTAIEDTRSLRAICFDLRSGKILRNIEIFKPVGWVAKHDRNSHATPTPVIGEKRVYVHFGTYGTAAIDRSTGKIVWKNQEIKLEHQWGPGSSPVQYKDLLLFNCDGMKDRFIVALNTETGKIAWKQDRSIAIDKGGHYRKAFSTPLLTMTNGRIAAISTGANQVSAYDASTGEELWATEFNGYAAVSTPIGSSDLLFITTGYGDHSLMAIHARDSQEFKAGDIAWKNSRTIPIIPSPIAVDGALYFTNDDGILQCLDAQTGEQHWKQRLGGNFASSPTFAGGRLYFHNNKGETFVIAPSSKELQLQETNKLDGNIQASMAVANNSLLIRTDMHLYRIDRSNVP